MHREESVSTLRFATDCKKIKNKAVLNAVSDDKTLLRQYKLRILKLQDELESEKITAAKTAAAEGLDAKFAREQADAGAVYVSTR